MWPRVFTGKVKTISVDKIEHRLSSINKIIDHTMCIKCDI